MSVRVLVGTVRSFLAHHGRAARMAAVISIVLGSSIVGLVVAANVLPPVIRMHAAPGCAERMHAQLFFGLLGPRGPIPESEWEAFLLDVGTPRFPDGLTVLHASGHWRRAGEPMQREASRVLEIVYDESPRTRRLIDEVTAIYKSRFQQESVMVVRAPAYVCF